MKVFFSDFAVGAYQSDALFVVRTRPVIDMTATLTISPSPIPLSSEGFGMFFTIRQESMCYINHLLHI